MKRRANTQAGIATLPVLHGKWLGPDFVIAQLLKFLLGPGYCPGIGFAAGQALAEIGEVSTETARLIERISADTQEQAATAGRVAATMKDILAVTEQTSLGTRQTAVSIGQLAELAVELKGSVSGFKV